MSGGAPSTPRLRADARRNADQIRRAAIDAFQGRGLTVPLEEVAQAAGVSKATIFNRFGGRIGLIDAVIEEVVAVELRDIIDRTRAIDDPWDRVAHYVTAIRDLQHRQPAANDAMLQVYPDAQSLVEICRIGGEINDELIASGRASGAVRAEFTADDLQALVHDNALALKHGTRPRREDYDRRTAYLLDGLRGR
ncbi:TetR/AcrR family transcriptional regulator [Saccharopolyspora dendranthemae]|uniref:TetR family transcriptional regulator n=1 Tax=Saccharopolyspora dendranthemae TaxID=1181886 RepID=A0A561UA00_9PSEU|nr:TetR/AcrR family transcriptional regulator [Saccharopolyspora dendranthemae]TWF96181.1 TetR family transcriptional regulator [Saccharopolyspora dendranthemae]